MKNICALIRLEETLLTCSNVLPEPSKNFKDLIHDPDLNHI